MSWRRVAAIWAVLAVLAAFVVVIGRVAPRPAEDAPAPVGPSLLDASAASVTSVTFRKEGRVVRATRRDGRWQTVEPADAEIASDLIDATIATLTAGQAAERLGNEAEHGLEAYGLDTPVAMLEVVMGGADAAPVTVAIGARNPTQTAVYARRNDQPAIYLVGMNLRYYIDLVFDAAAAR